ncbi:MAG: YihY/virulence factor BrkB family protein [Synechococcaceae cyanobacterium SM2_3_1]|nr:YihY/virulence factor BrkB family protein [Synechococcaceae cyanobacterium SM2_3_1]
MDSSWKDHLLKSRYSRLLAWTIRKWQKDECLDMGAALAFYFLISLCPIGLILLSISGRLLDPTSEVYHQILLHTQRIFPPATTQTVATTLSYLNQDSLKAGTSGFLLTLFAASGVFSALNRAVEKIWKIHAPDPPPSSWLNHAWDVIKDRLFAFLLMLSSIALILFSSLSNILLKIALNIVLSLNQDLIGFNIDQIPFLTELEFESIYLFLTIGIAILFKILPPIDLKWRDVLPGALLTGLLLTILQRLVSQSIIQLGSNYHSYGVVGSTIILLLWLYLACQILFLGCEFTYAYTHLFGSCHHPVPLPKG